MNKEGISVLLCTYNGKSKLSPTLEHLFNQKGLENVNWEILIIDNASVDGTSEWLKEYINDCGNSDKISLLYESTAGKLAAIKLGVSKAKYQYLLICDDDNWLANDYLIKGYNIFKNNPKIGVVGGNGRPSSNLQIPNWLIPHLHNYAAAPQQPFSADVTNSIGSVYGAGMFIRKEIYTIAFTINWPLFLTGLRNGNNLLSGEDTEICYVAIILGYRIFYSDDIKFEHYISSYKMDLTYLFRLFHLFGYANAVLYPYDSNDSLKNNYVFKIFVEIYRLVKYNLIKKKTTNYISHKKAYKFRLGYIKGLLFNYSKIHQLKTFLKQFDASTPHYFKQR